VLAAVLSDGSLAFARAVEADAWEETLEEQTAWQSQRARLLGGGSGGGAAAAVEAAGGRLAAPAPAPGARAAAKLGAAPHQAQRQRVAGAWGAQRVLLPLGAGLPGGGGGWPPGVPLAEGRRVKAAAWLGPERLLLVAAPHPEPGFEGGEGDALVEISARLPEPLMSAPEGEAPEAAGAVEVEEVGTSYAGAPVLAAAPLPPPAAATAGAFEAGGDGGAGCGGAEAGGVGVLLQLATGGLARCDPGGGAPWPLGPGASFPVPCPLMAPLPAGSGGGGGGAAIGLAPNGALYWGPRLVAGGVTSFALRWGGAGGPALLYTTRSSLLYVVMLSQLPGYVHREVRGRRAGGGPAATSKSAATHAGQAPFRLGRAPRPGL
jgi:elongator complex protein 1